jgi:hypothetical protein
MINIYIINNDYGFTLDIKVLLKFQTTHTVLLLVEGVWINFRNSAVK